MTLTLLDSGRPKKEHSLNEKTLLCTKKMLKQLGPRFVVYGLACGGDARTARFVVNFVAQRICAKTCKVVFANSSCGSAATLLFAPLFGLRMHLCR